MLNQFTRNGFLVKKHRHYGIDTLSKPGLDMFVQAVAQNDDEYIVRFGPGVASSVPFRTYTCRCGKLDLAVFLTIFVDHDPTPATCLRWMMGKKEFYCEMNETTCTS